jgi:ribosomal-protein-alanine N-acetyltransferase
MTIDCSTFSIRSWQHSDALHLDQYANDKDIWLNLRDRFPYPYTPRDAQEWIQLVTNNQPETNFALAVKGQAVGGFGIVLGDDTGRCSAEVGYWLGRAYWGQGIVSEALQQVTAYTLIGFDLTRLFAVPFAQNRASIRVFEKAGYRCEGIMRKSAIKNGVLLDQALYAFVDDSSPFG